MTISEFSRVLGGFPSILIFTHTRPDGDTLGSAAALKYAFEYLGKKADILCPSPLPDKYRCFSFYDEILAKIPAGPYGAHVAVDCSTEQMTGNFVGHFFSNKNNFNIDHHVSNTAYARYNFVANSASCAENIKLAIDGLGVPLTQKIAGALLLGIVTDTGCFAHKNVTPDTLHSAADLVAAGADLNEINYRMYKAQPLERARLFAIAASSLKMYHGGSLAIISVRKEDFAKTGATQDMTDGFTDFALGIEGTEVAVSVMETADKKFKVSFRSKGRVNVNEVASTFGGGGHVLASGCMLMGYYEDVIDKLVFTVGNYL